MKKIILLVLVFLGITLCSCNSNEFSKYDDSTIVKNNDNYYLTLTNEESIKLLNYSLSDFNLKNLVELKDLNQISNKDNINNKSYKKIIKLNFNNLTERKIKENEEALNNDKRIENYCSSEEINYKFNYDSLEANINYSKISYFENVTTSSINDALINSIEKKNDYIDNLQNNNYIKNEINKYEDSYFSNNSLMIIHYLLANQGCALSFVSLKEENNNLKLAFNYFRNTKPSAQVITDVVIFISLPNNYENYEMNVNFINV